MNHLEKIESYYEKFTTLDDDAKKAFLQKIASEEPEVYTQFVKVYESDQEASIYFNEIGEGLSQSFYDIGYEPGTIIGNYRLEQAIGAGGMAYVYKAERIDGVFQRTSAIKFIKRGIDTDEVIRRFNHERNILARLKHEQIAQLYDGGVSEEGLPYFVMEYIQGKDIISHCRENQISLKQRLLLFLQVGEAVDFAHKNLIVHRDIKPGNILIDEDGKAKLTDFGIAKLLEEQEESNITQIQNRVMTKEYASPEQQNGDYITTTSDVYQLGILLYELISEKKAWNNEAKNHQFTFDKKLIPTELKSIIQTATREEPENRYNSVEALLKDVQNFLESKPVKARGNSTWYLIKKLLIRNKKYFLIGISLFIIIASGLTKYILDINEARLIAEYRTQQTRNTLNVFMSSLLTQYPIFSNGDTLNVFQLIDQIEINIINTEVNDEFKAIFYDYLAEFYKLQGNYDDAIDYYNKSLNIFSNLQENNLYKNYKFDIYSNLGYCYLFMNIDSANVFYNYAIEEATKNSLACINPLSGIAYINTMRGNYEKADSCYIKALSNSNLNNSYNAIATAITLARYASFIAFYNFSDNKKLDSLFKKSFKIYNSKVSEFSNQEDIIFRDLSNNTLKENNPASYAEMLNYYGMYLLNISKYDSAVHYFSLAYEANLKYFGESNYKSLDNLNNIAVIQRNTGKVNQALKNLKKCWDMSQENKLIDPSLALNYYQNYASCYYLLGEYQTCLQVMDSLLQLKEKYAPDDVYAINQAKVIMAKSHYKLGDSQKAIALLNQIIIDHQAAVGEKGDTDLQAKTLKLLYLSEMGQSEKAKKIYFENKVAIEKRLGADAPMKHNNHQAYIEALLMNGNAEDAEKLIHEQMNDDISETSNYIYKTLLATCYFKSGENKEAQKLYQQLKNNQPANIDAILALQKLEKEMGIKL